MKKISTKERKRLHAKFSRFRSKLYVIALSEICNVIRAQNRALRLRIMPPTTDHEDGAPHDTHLSVLNWRDEDVGLVLSHCRAPKSMLEELLKADARAHVEAINIHSSSHRDPVVLAKLLGKKWLGVWQGITRHGTARSPQVVGRPCWDKEADLPGLR